MGCMTPGLTLSSCSWQFFWTARWIPVENHDSCRSSTPPPPTQPPDPRSQLVFSLRKSSALTAAMISAKLWESKYFTRAQAWQTCDSSAIGNRRIRPRWRCQDLRAEMGWRNTTPGCRSSLVQYQPGTCYKNIKIYKNTSCWCCWESSSPIWLNIEQYVKPSISCWLPPFVFSGCNLATEMLT